MIKKILPLYILLISCTFARAAETDSVFYNQFRREIGGWIAADATYSIYLPDGRTLWLFGDTFIGEVDENNAIIPGSKFIRNSAVIQDGDQLETLFGGTRSNPSDFIMTLNPDSTWYWPDHGVVDNDTLRIFVAKFRTNPDGPAGFNFEHAGMDVASFTYPGLQFLHIVPLHIHDLNGVLYGDRVMEDSGYLYIYGRRNDDPEINIPYPHVARTSVGSLMDQEWEFYNGNGWSSDPQDTKRINNFQVSQQYSVSPHKGKYILLTQDIWLSPEIWTFTSDSPVGPWANKKLIYSTPESEQNMFTYNAYAHPQFDQDDELLISYNTNGDFWSIFSNVELYRPRFIRVPYMNLDYDFWPNGIESNAAIHGVSPGIYPNPVEDVAHLSLELKEKSMVSINLLDLSGRVLRSWPDQSLNQGTQSLELDMTFLPTGIYLCNILINEEVHVIRVIITSRH